MSSQIDAIYPLTPVQETLLFHCVGSSGDPGLTQLVAAVRGKIDVENLERAWGALVTAHSALRTSIHWKDLESPVQVVRRSVPVEFRYYDLREEDSSTAGVKQIIEADRVAGFQFESAPLARLSVIQMEAERHQFVFSVHHIIADGWSAAILVRDLLTAYEALATKREPELASTDLKEYSRWLSSADPESAYDFWSAHLSGVKAARTPVSIRPATDVKLSRYTVDAHESLEKRLKEFSRSRNVTEGTVILAAWALVLLESAGSDRTVFGVVVSGRSADVANIENVVGPMSTTVPLCVRLSDDHLDQWLRTIQRDFQSASRFSYLPPGEILERSGLPQTNRLFDTVVAIQNYPKETKATSDFEIKSTFGDIVTVFALTLNWNAGDEPAQFFYDSSRITEDQVSASSSAFRDCLDRILNADDCMVRELITDRSLAPPHGAVHDHNVQRHTETQADATNELERRLSGLWCEILGLRRVGVTENFFDVGGTSILATRLASTIEKAFDTNVPVISIAQYPTVRRFASQFLGEISKSSTPGVELKDGSGDLPPLFTVYTPGGDPIVFADFARHFPSDRRVIGLEGSGLNEAEAPLETIEEMAGLAISQITTVQDAGPYHLFSTCGGGLPYEIARQLLEDGHHLGAVVVVDPGWIHPERRYPELAVTYQPRRRTYRERLARVLRAGWRWGTHKVNKRISRARRQRYLKSLDPRHRAQFSAYNRATNKYAPQKSEVRLTFIITEEWNKRPDLGARLSRWQNVAKGGVRVIDYGQKHGAVLSGEDARKMGELVETLIKDSEIGGQSPADAERSIHVTPA